ADNDRPIGIAVLVFHHHFVADARDEQRAAIETRPELADADTPRRRLLGRAGAGRVVPVELDQDAPIFVDVDLLVLLADDLRRLRADDYGMTRPQRHSVGNRKSRQLVTPRIGSIARPISGA